MGDLVRRLMAIAILGAAFAAGEACVAVAQSPMIAPEKPCEGLLGMTISPEQIGLASPAAAITAATVETVNTPLGEAKQYCQVLGQIAPRTVDASPIKFQVNLPSSWNARSLMMGGGGFNGTLITGLLPARDQPDSEPTPLGRGFVTFGTDSGHELRGPDDPEMARFALNDEMFRNYAFEAYKKVSNVAAVLIQSYYGRPAQFRYFLGGSEGGREALTMAQRYPENFDGIVAVVPVISWTGLFQSFFNFSKPQYDGGALGPAKIKLVAEAVNAACDKLDGIEDGVVSNYFACPVTAPLEKLRCPGGADRDDTCLSDRQLTTLQAAYGTAKLPFALPNGITSYPGRLFGGEIEPGADTGLSRWLSTGAVPTQAITDARGVLYGSNYVRFVIARDPAFDVKGYDPKKFAARVKAVAAMLDSTNPDLSAFYKRGGKLIIRENTGDLAQSPVAGMRYYESVIARMGQAVAEKFLRLYVSPASAHSGLAASLTTGILVPTAHDLLSDIDQWVSAGIPPSDVLTQVRLGPAPSFNVAAARPMCRYPLYPHYMSGDPDLAASYHCQPSLPKPEMSK